MKVSTRTEQALETAQTLQELIAKITAERRSGLGERFDTHLGTAIRALQGADLALTARLGEFVREDNR